MHAIAPILDARRLIAPLLLAMGALFTPLAAHSESGVLARIALSQKIRVAYPENSYPIAYKDEDGLPRGYSVDLCRRIVASIQRDLGLDGIAISWIEGNTPRRIAAVANGEAELDCGTTTMTLSRQRKVDFSYPVFVESGGILVLKDSGIGSLADLGGKAIGVIPETTTEQRLRPVLAERLINAELKPIKDSKDGREQLQAGAIDAFADNRLVLIGQVAASGETNTFQVIDTDFSVDPYAFALARDDADFRLAVNRGLAQIYASEEIDRIFARWFGADAQPTPLLDSIYFIFALQD
ncbi:amino acid ABC transporter substrate-binding protein [Thiorhodovibrio frisius]|uniref:Periplasmic component of amino acid ABC-type transporter/signal transduction system n=1 Tax=Thiorhodovibrio frisius TaxID=631362 RepID=H8Z0D0_9GAMM|nr:amino acid ABC transporter substrate-binding protein [Thiorhodovibrio frisius]EIC21231.1 periplasmic component of amino acid ABC-type transporter/signal transduction system [Thiorhodovibrio frisius]WPL23807.1 Glutamate/aspartate periplasmic-binding protein precursor [Thiorhodovibrio frisius]